MFCVRKKACGNRNKTKKIISLLCSNGFSLFELIITLIIISILSLLAIPMYSQYIVKEKRLEATVILSQLAGQLEQYYIVHQSYQGARLSDFGLTEKMVNGDYLLSIASLSMNYFELTATPLENQAQKDPCGTLTLNSLGEKGVLGNEKVINCW